MSKQVQGAKMDRCKKFLYNSDTKSILGRTAKSWVLIFIYYVCGYAFLAAYVGGMLCVFLFGFIDNFSPLRTGEHSLLMNKPAIVLVAKPNQFNTLVQVATYSSSINAEYFLQTKKLLNQYKYSDGNVFCSEVGPQPTDVKFPCRFDLNSLGPCSDPEDSLITNKKACVYLKLNRIYGWLPDVDLDTTRSNTLILVKCNIVNIADSDIPPLITYYPQIILNDTEKFGYIDSKYFPYVNQPGYHSPLVALRFSRIKFNTLFQMECFTVGLKNNGSGTQFEIFIGNGTVATE